MRGPARNRGLGAQIIGRWSDEGFYAGTMEAWVIVFKRNGTGWYAFERPGVSEVEVFKWALAADLLSMTTRQHGRIDGLGVVVRLEKDALGRRVKALVFDRPLWMGSSRFALESDEPAALRAPRRPGAR